MKDYLISIVIPVYNVEKYLKNCIDSVLNQTYQNIEIILIDDGSIDNSGKICDEYAKISDKVVVIHQQNLGASCARNVGIEIANGKYITFIDSDDIVEKKYIEYLYNLVIKNNVKMAIASYKIISEHDKCIDIGDGYEEKILKTEECLDRLLKEKGFTVSPCSKIYSKELFEEIKFPEGKLYEDNGTIYKFIMKCDNIAYGNESYYLYYRRNNSSTMSKFNLRKLDLIELTDNMCNEIEEVFPNLVETTEKKRITVRFSVLRMMNLKEDKITNKKRKEIEKFIKDRKIKIMKNKNMDTRDKIALICLLLGRRFFYFSWNVYNKIKY